MQDRKIPNGCAWVLLVFLVLVLLSLCFPTYSNVNIRGGVTLTISNGRQLVTAMRIYVSDNNGTYPAELGDLVTAGLLDRGRLDSLLASPLGAKPLGWTYLPGFGADSPPDQPVLVSPVLQNKGNIVTRWLKEQRSSRPLPPAYPVRVVATADGTTTMIKEVEFQKILKAKNIALPVAASPERKF